MRAIVIVLIFCVIGVGLVYAAQNQKAVNVNFGNKQPITIASPIITYSGAICPSGADTQYFDAVTGKSISEDAAAIRHGSSVVYWCMQRQPIPTNAPVVTDPNWPPPTPSHGPQPVCWTHPIPNQYCPK